jgi:hypothetical protein
MLKWFILSIVIAATGSFLLTETADRRSFGELMVRAAIADQAKSPGSRCPLSQDYIDVADLNLIAICSEYGLAAYDAARRYPTTAPKVFALYGQDQTFRAILDRYGHQVIPVVAHYVEHGSVRYQLRQTLGEAVQQLWEGKQPNWDPHKLSPEQIGLIAINQIDAQGQELLAEFEIVDGVAKRKPMTTAFLESKDFFFGHIQNLENVLVRGERLPTWKELGNAAIDTTVIVGGVGALGKISSFAEEAQISGAALEEGSAALVLEGAVDAIGTATRTTLLVGSIAVPVLVMTRPTLLVSGGGWIAEQLGYNRTIGTFVAYFIILGTMIALMRFLWLVVRPFLRLALMLLGPRRTRCSVTRDAGRCDTGIVRPKQMVDLSNSRAAQALEIDTCYSPQISLTNLRFQRGFTAFG